MKIFARHTDGLVEGFEQIESPPDVGPPPEWYLSYIEQLLATGFIEVVSGWPLPPRPNAHSRHFITDGVVRWDDPRTSEQAREDKFKQVTAARLSADADHFVYMGKQIRTADKDMTDLLVADARISKGSMPANWPGGWKAIDNTYVVISTVAEWDAFFIAMYDAGIANYTHSQTLKTRISAADTPAQVDEINW